MFAGRLADGGGVLEVAEAARAAPPAPEPPRASDLLLDGLALLITEGYAAAAPMLKRALSAFRSDDISQEEALRWLWLACHVARLCGTTRAGTCSAPTTSSSPVMPARSAVLPIALNQRMGVHVHAGELAAAASLVEEAEAVTEATGSQLAPYGALALAAWRGREAEPPS